MYCPKCGTQNPENAGVCLSCSQPLPASPQVPQTGAKTSALAIWSFILAIIGFFTFMITALPALICGIISLVKISKSNSQLKGTGLAVSGIVLSSIGVIILPLLMIMLAVLMPALAKVRVLAQRTTCSANLSIISRAMMNYTANHDDMYPPADSWCDLLVKDYNVSPKQFCCAGGNAVEGKSSYAININVAGKKVSEIPPDTVLLFETTPAVNPAGEAEILSTESHQRDGCNILFADCHVEFVKKEKLSTLRWKPD